MKHLLFAALVLLTTVGASAKPLILCLQPSDKIVAMHGCDSTIQPIENDDNIPRFVSNQLKNPGNVMGWIGNTSNSVSQDWVIHNYVSVVDEFAKQGADRVTILYVKDEMDLCPTGPCIGRDGELIRQATDIAHSRGFITGVVLTQNVIFSPGFKLPHTDVLGIDPYYVAMTLNLDMGGCNLSANPILNQWRCSVKKIRELGWVNADGSTKKLVFVGQGFGIKGEDPAFRAMYLQLQAEAYAEIRLEVDAAMSWGCYLGADALQREPNLEPLCGTPDEPKVTPYGKVK